MKRRRNFLKIIIGVLLFFCLGQISNGQDVETWIKTYGIEYTGMTYPYDLYPLEDGGYMIEGNNLMKVDSVGDFVWLKQYDLGSGPIDLTSMGPTDDNGYILAAVNKIDGEDFMSLIKIDMNFDTLWTKTYYDLDTLAYSSSVHQTIDGGYIIAGECVIDTTYVGMGVYHTAGLLIKTDETGNVIWTITDESAHGYPDVLQTQENDFLISAVVRMVNILDNSGYSPASESNRRIIRTDSVGNLIEDSFFNYCKFSGFCEAKNGGIIIVGRTDIYGEDPNILLAEYGSSGWAEDWARTYGGDEPEIGIAVEPTDDGGYIILGAKVNNYSLDELILAKTNSKGTLEWTNNIERNDSEYYSFGLIKQTIDGGYILAGTIGTTGQGERFLCLIKTDENGNVTESSGVKDANEFGFRIYPNPANNLLTIEQDKQDRCTYEITSLNGQMIHSGTYAGQSHQIDISSFQTGVYLITIRSQDHVMTKKFTKK